MAVKSNARFTDFPDYVEDSSVTATAVVNVFRGTGNVTMFQIVNGSANAWFQIFDETSVTTSPTLEQTDPVISIFCKASATVICSCDMTFSNAISYSASSNATGTSNPTQTVALTLIGDP